MMRISRPFAVLFASTLFLLSMLPTGCGDGRPSRVPISGCVSIDGKPLTAGFVQLIPEKDRAAIGKIGSDGRFALTTYDKNDGCVPGKHQAIVIGSEWKGPNAMMWLAPRKYAQRNTSGLQFEIAGPTDNLEIKLTWDGGKPFMEYLEGEKPRGK
jgi:hypothetical protein